MNKYMFRIIILALITLFFMVMDARDSIVYFIIFVCFVAYILNKQDHEHRSNLEFYRIRKNNELQEVENENKYHESILLQLIKSMSLPLLFLDKNGTIVFTNERFRNEFSIKHLRGLNYKEVLTDQLLETVDLCCRSQKAYSTVIGVKDKYYHLDASSVFIDKDKEKFDGTLIIFTDISQVKELENMQKQFLSDISHELKTPMAAIIGSAEILKRDGIESNDIFEEFVDILLKESYRMQNIISDILELSRLDQAKVTLNYESLNIKDVVKETIDLFEPIAKEKNITLKYINTIEHDIVFDYSSFKAILNNLVSNAIKYSDQGCIHIYSSIVFNNLELKIEDEGIGISKDNVMKIFERFYQVDKARSSKISTGLGLSIVRKMVELNKGSIAVESVLSKGTTFTVTIPL